MNTRNVIVGAVSMTAVIAVTAVFAAEPETARRSIGWQHLAFETGPSLKEPDTGRRINQLGRDGWELVNVTQVSKEGSTENLIYFFKKPLE